MAPPVRVAADVQLPPLPRTRKPPGLPDEVFVKIIPLGAPFAETLVNRILSGVGEPTLVPTISTAVAVPVSAMVPLVYVIVPVLWVAWKARWFALGSMSRSAKVTAAAFDVRETPVPVEPDAAVLPKL